MAVLIRSFDWASTALGPIESWSESLCTVVDMALASPVAAIVLWGPDLIQIYNEGWAKLHSTRHPIALGQRSNDCFPELVEMLESVYEKVLCGEGVVLEDSLLPVLRTGKVTDAWWDVVYFPVLGISGAVAGIFCTLAETTAKIQAEYARRQAEADLHAARERQAFLLHFGDAIRSLTKPDEIAIAATRMVADYFHVDRCFISRISRDQGKAWIENESCNPGLISVEGEVNLADFPEVMRIAETETMVFRDVQADTTLSARDKAALVGLGFGAFIAAVLRKGERNYFWDLVVASLEPRNWSPTDVPFLEELAERTWVAIDRARTENALLETEKLAAVGRLASSIAHEINNPLEAVTNLLYLMENSQLPLETAQYLKQAQLELGRVGQITIETLRFSRRNTKATVAKLSELVDSVNHLHEGKLKAAGVQVDHRYRFHRDLICFPNEIRQVIANLIGNAIESMTGLENSRLCLGVREARNPRTGDAGVRLTVADTGSGIDHATLTRIWEPFFTTKSDTGTGLGLWVTQEIIRKHRGLIAVRSSTEPHNHGSVFTVFFPHDQTWKPGDIVN